MEKTVLIGRGRDLDRVPEAEWKEKLSNAPRHIAPRLAFMNEDHHRVRNFVVSELPRHAGKPLDPPFIARRLGIPPERCNAILDDLERHLFFLVRNDRGEVAWAFTTTVEQTPHRLKFSSGEEIYGA